MGSKSWSGLTLVVVLSSLSCNGDDDSAVEDHRAADSGAASDGAVGDSLTGGDAVDAPSSDGEGGADSGAVSDGAVSDSLAGGDAVDVGSGSDTGVSDAPGDIGELDAAEEVTTSDAASVCAPTIDWDAVNIQIAGRRELVWNHTNSVESNNISDARLTPYRSAGGLSHLMLTHFENYRISGSSLDALDPAPQVTFLSSANPLLAQADYGYHQWIMSPYSEDGMEFYALAHSEWYGCLAHPNDPVRGCDVGGNQVASWVNAITLFHSSDGGASWAPGGVGAEHVVLGPPGPYPDWAYWTSPVPLNYGMFHPSNIVKEGTHYYSVVRYTHRNSASTADISGLVLMRTDDLASADTWRTWEGGSSFGPAVEPLMVLPGTASFDHVGVTFNEALCRYLIVFFNYADSKVYFTSTITLSNPQLEAPRLLAGQEYHLTAPSSVRPGFVAANYANLLEPAWPGFNFEGSRTAPYLYYSTFDPTAPLTRDVYRVALAVNDGVYVSLPLPEGLFMVGGGIYWANASGSYCVFPDWETFVALTGRTDIEGIPQYDGIPGSMMNQGVCQG